MRNASPFFARKAEKQQKNRCIEHKACFKSSIHLFFYWAKPAISDSEAFRDAVAGAFGTV
jgi:hypothetical protein